MTTEPSSLPSENKSGSPARLPLLDGVRGFAASGVALSHFFVQMGHPVWGEAAAALCVEIFFPLSGFVLAPQIMRAAQEPGLLRIFYLRRWMRTLWPYWIALTMAAVIASPPIPWRQASLYFFCLQDWHPAWCPEGFYPIAWSLAIEEWYYLVFPLWILLGVRLGLGAMASSLAFLIVFQLIKLPALMADPGGFLRTGTWFRLDAIALGFIGYGLRNHLGRGLFPLMAAVGSAALLAYATWLVCHQDPRPVYRWLFINGAGIFFTLLVIFLGQAAQPGRDSPLARFCLWAGKISYPVYLLHLFFIPFAVRLAGQNLVAGLATYGGLLVFAAAAFHQVVERPILACRPNYPPEA